MAHKPQAKDETPDLLEAVIHLTSEVVSIREELNKLPERTAAKAVQLLFDQLKDLDEAGFYKLKVASHIFADGRKIS
jgi:hypothetical protein